MLLGFVGIHNCRSTRNSLIKMKLKKNKYAQIRNRVLKNVDEATINLMLLEAGLRINVFQYQLIRYTLLIAYALATVFLYITRGSSVSYKQILIIFAVLILTSPKEMVAGKKTPFTLIMGALTQKLKSRRNVEVYRALSQSKNICLTRKKNLPGSQFVLEQLKQYTELIKPVFSKMLSLWNYGKYEEACRYFSEAIGTSEAEEISQIFLKLDSMDPEELINQVDVIISRIKANRETRKLKENEVKSNLVFLIVIVSSFLVMLNFVIVGFWIEQMKWMMYY